jgi:hypothetical protein
MVLELYPLHRAAFTSQTHRPPTVSSARYTDTLNEEAYIPTISPLSFITSTIFPVSAYPAGTLHTLLKAGMNFGVSADIGYFVL